MWLRLKIVYIFPMYIYILLMNVAAFIEGRL